MATKTETELTGLTINYLSESDDNEYSDGNISTIDEKQNWDTQKKGGVCYGYFILHIQNRQR